MGEPPGLADEQARERVARLEGLLGRLEELPGPSGELAREAIEALAELYGAALCRTVGLVAGGEASLEALAADELVGHLLLLHGLHPEPAERRVARALAALSAELDGAALELTRIEDGVAHVRAAPAGCQASGAALTGAVHDAVLEAAPELSSVETTMARVARPVVVPLERPRRREAAR